MTTMSFVAFSSFARNARRASRVGVGSALCVALKVTSTRFRSGFSFRCRTSSCMIYRSIRRKTSRALDFAVSSARTITTPWVGMPYRTAADGGASAMQTRARRSSSPRTSTRTRSSDLKASESTRHASGVMVPGGFVTRSALEPIRWSASRNSGSSWRFVLKSTTQMSGVRPRATRSSVQKSPTVTTGFARPIVGKMLGPWTRAPIGHRRYSRRESGSRNVTLANSANAEGELSVDMDAHLLHDHGSAFPLPHAAFRPRAVLFDPVELPERRLTHREADLRLPRRPFVQGNRDDARPDLVADPEVALRVFADQPLALFVDVDPIVHDLRDVQEAVQRTESHEGAELKDFHDRALDDLLQCRREHEGVVPHPLVDRPVPVDDPALADPLDVARNQGEGLVRPDLAFQRGAGELPGRSEEHTLNSSHRTISYAD